MDQTQGVYNSRKALIVLFHKYRPTQRLYKFSQIIIWESLKVISNAYLNGHTFEFYSQTEKLALHYVVMRFSWRERDKQR